MYAEASKPELWYPDKIDLHIPSNREQLALQKTNPFVCESIGAFHSFIRDKLHRWNDCSDMHTHLLSLDGLSGSGKSTLSQDILTTVKHIPGVSLYPVPVDAFIATARGSPLRSLMLESRELFWKLIYDRQSMIEVLKNIVGANGEGCSIPVSHHYNRSDGSVGPATVHVPAGKKVVMVDGIDSTRILQTLEEISPCPQTRIMVITPPHIALQRAAERDAAQGRRNTKEALMIRTKEFQYLLPQITQQNMRNVDVMYFPNRVQA